MKLSILALVATLALIGCSSDTLVPTDRLDDLPAGLEVGFTLSAAEVGPHERFRAHLAVTNRSADTVRVVTSNSCLAVSRAMRNGRRVPLTGTSEPCFGVITTHVFAPGQSWTRSWDMAAELYAEEPGDTQGAPAPSGVYQVQAVFGTYPPDGSGGAPTAQATLRVR